MPRPGAAGGDTRPGGAAVSASHWGRLTWACYALLFGQQALDAVLSGAPWFIWLLKLLTLSLFLPGMYRDNLRSFIWLCFVLQGYFLILVQRIFAQPSEPIVITGLVAVVVLFVAAMMYVRTRARELRAGSDSTGD